MLGSKKTLQTHRLGPLLSTCREKRRFLGEAPEVAPRALHPAGGGSSARNEGSKNAKGGEVIGALRVQDEELKPYHWLVVLTQLILVSGINDIKFRFLI